MIYLDNAATTFPKPEEVYVAIDKANREYGFNAGRGSYKLARKASNIIIETKSMLRKLIHAESSASVVFSPSITIALNQVIQGMNWKQGDIVYLSPYEHNAVARTMHKVAIEKGITVKLIPLQKGSLEIDLEKTKYEFSRAIPTAVICTHVSNVTGYILPVKDIFEEAKKYEAITVLDSAQSLGLIEVDTRFLPVDIIAFAGHKTLYGPIGIGGFINVKQLPLEVYITGGTGSDSLNLNMPNGSEVRYEVASSNISAISGLYEALKILDVDKLRKNEIALTNYLIQRLESIDEVKLLLPADLNSHVGIVSFICEGMSSEDIGTILDEDFDIAVRTGYHCAPFIHDYLDDKTKLGTVRVGLGQFNSQADIDLFIDALSEILD